MPSADSHPGLSAKFTQQHHLTWYMFLADSLWPLHILHLVVPRPHLIYGNLLIVIYFGENSLLWHLFVSYRWTQREQIRCIKGPARTKPALQNPFGVPDPGTDQLILLGLGTQILLIWREYSSISCKNLENLY